MNQIILFKDYLSSSLKKNDLFFLSLDVFSRVNGSAHFNSNASKNYFGYFFSNVYLYEEDSKSSRVVLPSIFCKFSDGNMSSWSNIFDKLEFFVNNGADIDVSFDKYISPDQRKKDLNFQEGKFFNAFSGQDVYREIIKRDLGLPDPVKEMNKYGLIKFPDFFNEYLIK